jgi:hypothetical protein
VSHGLPAQRCPAPYGRVIINCLPSALSNKYWLLTGGLCRAAGPSPSYQPDPDVSVPSLAQHCQVTLHQLGLKVGSDNITVTIGSEGGSYAPRTYTSLTQLALEVGYSRALAGVVSESVREGWVTQREGWVTQREGWVTQRELYSRADLGLDIHSSNVAVHRSAASLCHGQNGR